jgi:hypothetical protein
VSDSMRRTEGDRERRRHLADAARGDARLLPWTSDTGKPCYLSTDSASGKLARLADEMELVQLSMADDVLWEARKVLGNPLSPHAEIRYAGIRLAECLADVLRIAESRGMRLPDGVEGP